MPTFIWLIFNTSKSFSILNLHFQLVLLQQKLNYLCGSNTKQHNFLESFKHLGLSEEVLKVIAELGFEKPSDIQARSIPLLLHENRDFIGLAQTGTGKTAAFGLPLLERIDPKDKSTQALILAPTRELGQQIAEQLTIFSKYMQRVNVLAVYGGASIVPQIKALRQPQQVVIATPGRLIDLVKRKAIKLNQIRCLVLDEADEMLNMGFKEDLDTILSYTSEEKMTWLFSATMSREIRNIVKTYMDDPLEVKIDAKNVVNTNIEHQYSLVRQSDKKEALTRFLDASPDLRGVVFCRTKRDTQDLAEILLQENYKADALHGDLSQHQRDRVMRRFKSKELQILIATDVAARGIDVNDLTHVFHYTLPDDVAYYTHRSGRTARAGKEGISIAFINGREKSRIQKIQKVLGISFEQVLIPSTGDIMDNHLENWCHKVLETKTKNKIDPALLEKANLLFGNLSKEELTAKIVMQELEKISLGTEKDLNKAVQDSGGGKSKSKKYRSRGGGGRGRNYARSGRSNRGRGKRSSKK